MIFEQDFITGIKDVGKYNLIKNRSLLEILENVGAYQSDIVGYGINDIPYTHLSWILLGWKMKVIKRPKYGEILHVKTWAKDMNRIISYRDFEIYDKENNLCVIATSKWAIMNSETRKPMKITKEISEKYQCEEINVFENKLLDKIQIPDNFSNSYEYTTTRRDIDFNGHMHNLYYLDMAYNTLPKDVYLNRPYNNVEIQYKKEIIFGDKIICKYSLVNNQHIVAIYSQDEKTLHCLIKLY